MEFVRNISRKSSEFRFISKQMNNTIIDDNFEFNITKIYKVQNPSLRQKYVHKRYEIKQQLGDFPREVILYHGTPNALSIAENGFRMEYAKLSDAYENGIIFFHNSAYSSISCARQPCRQHFLPNCRLCVRTVLICRVTLGRSYESKSGMQEVRQPPPRFHSITSHSGNVAKKIIFDGFQALPEYLVEHVACEKLPIFYDFKIDSILTDDTFTT